VWFLAALSSSGVEEPKSCRIPKKIFREHAEILKAERELLADAHRAHGSYLTNLRWGLGLIALAVAELIFAIRVGSPGAVLVLLPILMFAGFALAVTQTEMRMKYKSTLSKADQTIQDGYRSLTEKYPAFDPRQPRVLPPKFFTPLPGAWCEGTSTPGCILALTKLFSSSYIFRQNGAVPWQDANEQSS
jgi:hypothetical protein